MSMMMKTAFLFPGQGSQKPGMLNDLASTDPYVVSLLSEAREVLKVEIVELDSMEKLASTINVQLCLLIAGVIAARRLLARGIKADFVAGHSVGAFGAAVISGVISFKQALNLVYNRAQLMESAYPANYGMAALVGFTANRLKPYLEHHNSSHATVYLSNINAADQLVIAGELSSIALLIEDLQKAGIQKAKILDVKVPSHCELMNGVSEALKLQLEGMDLKAPVIPVASNTTGRLLKTADVVSKDLWQSVSSPVKWYDATTLIYEQGARVFIEMAPSGVLAKIAETTFPEARILSVNESQINQLAILWNNYRQENK
jgi:malonate decarboxylase epsilon subunit